MNARDAERRFENVFPDGGSMPPNYVEHYIDNDSEKLIIVVTDDRKDIRQYYIDLIGENYSEYVGFDKHELAYEELVRISEEAVSYLNSEGYKCSEVTFSEIGNIIALYVNDENKGACGLADELSEKYGIWVLIEIGGDVELVHE